MVNQTSLNQKNDEEDLISEFSYLAFLTLLGDAFVAFGGNPDLTGVVDLNQMTNLIETEFKLEVNVKVKSSKTA